MNVLVTGARGFIGRNLVENLKILDFEVSEFDIDSDINILDEYCRKAEFVFHLAGVNRPQVISDFMEGNYGFTSVLLNTLRKHNNKCPIMLSSSIQAELDNPYGQSKKAGEDLIFEYGRTTGVEVYVYRFPNVFGKWCKPNYNSVIATFCHNIANDLPIKINDPNVVLNIVYIDDVVKELINALNGNENKVGNFCSVPITYSIKLGEIADLINDFKKSRDNLLIPDMADQLTRKLYAAYLSYLPEDKFRYGLEMKNDNRGSFTEFIKTESNGQVSINISKPYVTKGNHWHNTKNEKFLVVSGKGVIKFRKVGSSEIQEYHVSGNKLEVIDIPTGYIHNLTNLGEDDMVTIMWASEVYDPDNPDTYFQEVEQ